MFKKIDHLVIVVRDVQQATRDYEKQLGVPPANEPREVKGQGYISSAFRIGDTALVLAQPISDNYQAGAAMKRTLDSRGEGLHNLSFAVESVDVAMESMKAKGQEYIPSAHSHSYFLHPKKMHGVLIQIMERK